MSLKRFVAAALAAVLAFGMSAGVAQAADSKAPKVVNINTATAAQFAELPGVGEKLAARIVEHRQKQGPFKATQELMNVKGIGEKNLQKLQPYLSVSDAKPASR